MKSSEKWDASLFPASTSAAGRQEAASASAAGRQEAASASAAGRQEAASALASVQPPEMGKRPDFSIVAAAKTAVVRKRS
jgi:hypothetical protein